MCLPKRHDDVMKLFKKLLSFAFVMNMTVACSALFFQGPLQMNDMSGVGNGDGNSADPVGDESDPTATFGQLSGGNVRVTIPLAVLGVTVDQLDSVAVTIVAEDADTRAYELVPSAMYQTSSDAIVFVVNQLEDSDALTVDLIVGNAGMTFSATVSSLTQIAVVPTSL
jgi:hypothetical protein